tara:strand:- start:601 stop:819 length:219 start_codon:yes stop_codon:yes gene_type:complete
MTKYGDTIVIPKEVLGKDVRVSWVISGMTFGPQIISADMNYDHDTMESDAIEYIRDLEDDYVPTDDGSWEGR